MYILAHTHTLIDAHANSIATQIPTKAIVSFVPNPEIDHRISETVPAMVMIDMNAKATDSTSLPTIHHAVNEFICVFIRPYIITTIEGVN